MWLAALPSSIGTSLIRGVRFFASQDVKLSTTSSRVIPMCILFVSLQQALWIKKDVLFSARHT